MCTHQPHQREARDQHSRLHGTTTTTTEETKNDRGNFQRPIRWTSTTENLRLLLFLSPKLGCSLKPWVKALHCCASCTASQEIHTCKNRKTLRSSLTCYALFFCRLEQLTPRGVATSALLQQLQSSPQLSVVVEQLVQQNAEVHKTTKEALRLLRSAREIQV